MAIIRMRDHLYDEIVNYAKEHLPEEACGLLAENLGFKKSKATMANWGI